MCLRSVRETELGCSKCLLADWISAGCISAYRLGESHTGDRPVKYSHPDHMERVEAHGVPNTNVRSEQLNRQVREMKSDRGTVFHQTKKAKKQISQCSCLEFSLVMYFYSI